MSVLLYNRTHLHTSLDIHHHQRVPLLETISLCCDGNIYGQNYSHKDTIRGGNSYNIPYWEDNYEFCSTVSRSPARFNNHLSETTTTVQETAILVFMSFLLSRDTFVCFFAYFFDGTADNRSCNCKLARSSPSLGTKASSVVLRAQWRR